MVPPAVLLDALGTLVQLERPWPLLVAAMSRRGVEISEAQARDAMLAEIAYYREHHDEAGTRDGLADLRGRCAVVLGEALGECVSGLSDADIGEALLESLRFSAYPEVPGALARLREQGSRLVVVSNWDVSLHDVLQETGLAPLIDGVVVSAQEGVAKPDRRIFQRGLEVAGAHAAEAIHAGDSLEADVAGAIAAGIRAVFVDRDGAGSAVVHGADVLGDLSGLPALAGG